jgi:diguanylate cyclase (GGDEF)-like protein
LRVSRDQICGKPDEHTAVFVRLPEQEPIRRPPLTYDDKEEVRSVTDRRNRWFVLVCWLGAAEVAAYFTATRLVSPAGTSGKILGDLVFPQLEALTAVMLVLAGRRTTGRTRRFCWFLAASTFMGLCGDITWAVLVLVLHSPPLPSLADVFYLSSVTAIFPALWSQFGSPLRRWRQTLDSSMVALLIIYTAFAFVLRPQIHGGLNLASAVADVETALVLIAGVWATFATLTVDRRLPFGVRLIVIGTVAQSAAWLAYAYLVNVRGIADGSWLYTDWQASWVIMVAGCVALLLGVERRRSSRLWSTSTWVGTGVVTGLIVVTLADSTAIRTAPVRVLAALIGLALLLLRLQLTVRDRGRLAAEMHRLAETDVLTGVPNRRAFEQRLAAAARNAAERGAPFGLLVIDIDHFKVVNDGYGHPFGDEVLIHVTRRLAACLRPLDALARLGGEEFGVLAHGVTPAQLADIAERCRRAVAAEPIEVEETAVPVTVSIGAACMPDHASSSTELVRIADRALYQAKDMGRNRVDVGAGTSPQTAIPIPETGVLRSLEALADRYAGAGSGTPDCAIVGVADRLCGELGVSVDERRRCLAATRLRDVGKIGVPPAILGKSGRLTAAERSAACEHVRAGVEMLEAFPETRELAPIVGQHHERFDGRGYPSGSAGHRISLAARIIAVAEAWTDARTTRPDRRALDTAAARAEIVRGAGSRFDPQVVAGLMSLVDEGAIEAPRGHGLAA